MARFATVADLANYLGEAIPAADPRAEFLLDLASAAVQGYTRQTIELVNNDPIVLNGPGNRVLLLPELPVVGVSAVSVAGTALVAGDWKLTDAGILWRADGTSWGTGVGLVAVTYSHGYAVIPDDIRAVVLAAAGRGLSNPTGATREQIGNYSIAYPAAATNLGATVFLTETEQRALDRYRLRDAA